jgi:hypothetical protein
MDWMPRVRIILDHGEMQPRLVENSSLPLPLVAALKL